MAIKVGINGFGRIGRMVFRAAVENFAQDIEIVGINDLLDPEYLAYMLKYDSVHGIFNHDIKVEGNYMIVDGKRIRLTAEKDPTQLKWDEVGAEVVVESTGVVNGEFCGLGADFRLHGGIKLVGVGGLPLGGGDTEGQQHRDRQQQKQAAKGLFARFHSESLPSV